MLQNPHLGPPRNVGSLPEGCRAQGRGEHGNVGVGRAVAEAGKRVGRVGSQLKRRAGRKVPSSVVQTSCHAVIKNQLVDSKAEF